jgi:hypothetical protein
VVAAFPGVERFVLLLERGAQPLELRRLFGQHLFEFRDALFGGHTRLELRSTLGASAFVHFAKQSRIN